MCRLATTAVIFSVLSAPQISKQGGPIEVTNEEQIMTVGISFTSPVLQIPDVLLLARPIYLSDDPTLPHDTKFHPERKVKYELSR